MSQQQPSSRSRPLLPRGTAIKLNKEFSRWRQTAEPRKQMVQLGILKKLISDRFSDQPSWTCPRADQCRICSSRRSEISVSHKGERDVASNGSDRQALMSAKMCSLAALADFAEPSMLPGYPGDASLPCKLIIVSFGLTRIRCSFALSF